MASVAHQEENSKRLENKIDNSDKRLEEKIDDLDKRLGDKIDNLDKRLGSDEFLSRGVLIGLIIAIVGGFLRLFGFGGNV